MFQTMETSKLSLISAINSGRGVVATEYIIVRFCRFLNYLRVSGDSQNHDSRQIYSVYKQYLCKLGLWLCNLLPYFIYGLL